MGKNFSIYLDLVRFLAACLVYIYHSNQRLLINDILPASNFGHSSVIVFFVLSGFVIAFITDTKEKDWAVYAASRISRIYSVAAPAVFITIVLDGIGRSLYPALYAYPFDHFIARIGASLMLLNEVWFVSVTSFSNVPYWSVTYEMWYYVGFGLLSFLPGRAKWYAVAVLFLILGPKVLLLAPIWMLGVLLYRWELPKRLSITSAWLMLLTSTIGIVTFHYFGVTEIMTQWLREILGPDLHVELTFSKYFASDYLLGILVFMNFAAMRLLSEKMTSFFLAIEKPIRFLASFTFSLYLLHQPLFLFWAAVLRGDPSGYRYWASTTALVAASVFLISWATERKRHILRRALEHNFLRLQKYIKNKNQWVS